MEVGCQRHIPEKNTITILQDGGWSTVSVWTGKENLAPHRDSILGQSVSWLCFVNRPRQGGVLSGTILMWVSAYCTGKNTCYKQIAPPLIIVGTFVKMCGRTVLVHSDTKAMFEYRSRIFGNTSNLRFQIS